MIQTREEDMNSYEQSVCGRCIEEDSLAIYINGHASVRRCSFCSRRSSKRFIAMPLNELLDHICERIECEYEDAAEGVGYESAEGGYLLPTMTSDEVLEEVGLAVDNERLFTALVRGLPDKAWVRCSPYSLPPEDALRLSWSEFVRLIKHKVRYLLFPSEPDDDRSEATKPADMLDQLGEIFVESQLLSPLKKGTRLFRIRCHKAGQAPQNNLKELGSPPVECTLYSNRMSPAGMSMFYAALDEATALAETTNVRLSTSNSVPEEPSEATIGTFELTKDLVVLNLVNLPPVPSVFDEDEAKWNRPSLLFLHHFVRDFAQPVEKDGREHVDYVPSQVVTEYVRYRLAEKAGKPINGILYRSARKKNGRGCVLFVEHEDCVEDSLFHTPPTAPLKLLTRRTRTVPVNTVS